jgi:signal transduction histidine kinase
MGIGAFESREFIRSLGGNINVQSKPGQGSVFRISIPCVEESNIGRTYRPLKGNTQ